MHDAAERKCRNPECVVLACARQLGVYLWLAVEALQVGALAAVKRAANRLLVMRGAGFGR
jgi:hypothetical protein